MKKRFIGSNDEVHHALFEALINLKTVEEVQRFMKDLCTPQELTALAERWRVCQLLDDGELTYREISQETGVSLATITRVARFLNNEPHQGYAMMLKRVRLQKRKRGKT